MQYMAKYRVICRFCEWTTSSVVEHITEEMGARNMLSKWLAKDDQGFTLVELMMVIVILAILTGVAVPMVGKMQKNAWTAKLTSLADSLGSAIVLDAMMDLDGTKDGAHYVTTEDGAADPNLAGLVEMPKDVGVIVAESDGTYTESGGYKAFLIVKAGSGNEVTIQGTRKGKGETLLGDSGMEFSWGKEE